MVRESFQDAMQKLESGVPPAASAGFLGCSLDPREANLVILPVPWEATTSYGGGTAAGPEAIVAASHQVDLDDGYFGKVYRKGITFAELPEQIKELNQIARTRAVRYMEGLGLGTADESDLKFVNQASQTVNEWVYTQSKLWLGSGKSIAVVGGDHSSPFGAIKALADHHKDGFGILHIDAHHDLREAYAGFTDSHASIHFNVMTRLPNVSKLVQVAIRDYCAEERDFMKNLGPRGTVFYAADIFRRRARGEHFGNICDAIVRELPAKVYISFDIDGLDPSCCPGTGTPVPGGLLFEEAVFLLECLAESGKKVIGFDLCEVAPTENSEWDANVGARILYKLCGLQTGSRVTNSL